MWKTKAKWLETNHQIGRYKSKLFIVHDVVMFTILVVQQLLKEAC